MVAPNIFSTIPIDFSLTYNVYHFTYYDKKAPGLQVTAEMWVLNPLNPELNPICYLLALLEAHHFLHVSRIRVKLLTLR